MCLHKHSGPIFLLIMLCLLAFNINATTFSVTTTSDAGAGIGYSGFRIRGSDPTRINVTVNGIPLNDSESQGVWWVNMPDFTSSVENIQIQKYEPNQGFKTWHCERSSIRQQTRCLAFMTYLNDVPDGGTEFMYQKLTSPAKKGLTMIWPSDWTHVHKGQISKQHTKYIITGWLNYKA